MIEYILIEHQDDLNEQIQKPIQQSHRIKFTTFDVSTNYVVFGASSGGLYIYKRKPCIFLKILPTKEGVIDKLSISNDECFVALSNPKGLIIIIENCFTGHDVKFQIYNQHDNNRITVLKWHLQELYSGDINGKVCVTAMKSILSKSIFQIPFATLMHLDSSIIQIDCYLQYLLISTLTKTLFCDRAQEQYKQIGKKLRLGPHGACFQNLPEQVEQSQLSNQQEPHSSEDKDGADDVVIFCSRPGSRLWQVDFNSSVVCTHQLKNAKPFGNCLFKITDRDNCRAMKCKINLTAENESATNFYRIHVLKCNLLLTFSDNAVYILRVIGSKVILLYKLLFSASILDIRIVGDIIYILLDTLILRSYSIYDVENFVLYALNMEQYLLCADICVDFKESIYELLKQSDNSQILYKLKLNLEKARELNLLDELKDLFDFISSKHKALPVETIATQNHHCHPSKNRINTPSHDKVIKTNEFDDDAFCVSVIIKQYMLDLQYNVDYPDYADFLEHKSMFQIQSLFESIGKGESDLNVDHKELTIWCSGQFLRLVAKNIATVSTDEFLKDYSIKCFRNINSNSDMVCGKCKYPLPNAKDTIPNYYQLFCDIFKEDSDILSEIATEVPYVWKCLLECDFKSESVNKLLPIIIQFSDIAVLEKYSSTLNYDLWDEAVNLMIKIKSKCCLYCDEKFEIDLVSTMSWQSFANVGIRAMGPTIALKLFKNYAGFIGNLELGPEFYQNFIFVAAMDNAGKDRGASTQIFKSAMADEFQKIEMESSLAKYLNNVFLHRNNHSHLDISPMSSLKNILSNKL